jgi:hypothetical protein
VKVMVLSFHCHAVTFVVRAPVVEPSGGRAWVPLACRRVEASRGFEGL